MTYEKARICACFATTVKGFHHRDPTQLMKPLQGNGNSRFQNPGCAQSRPWALRWNPFGVETKSSTSLLLTEAIRPHGISLATHHSPLATIRRLGKISP